MHIHTYLGIGQFHTNFCEDFLIVENIGSKRKLIAVMDGCSMGRESVFAAHLFGKLLRKIAKKHFYEEFISQTSKTLPELLQKVFEQLFEETNSLKNTLDLETNELLSTLIVGIVDFQTHEAQLLTVGDGIVCTDSRVIEYNQNDKPDYLAYHLQEDFNHWYNGQKQFISLEKVSTLAISTDGIFTFHKEQQSDGTHDQIVSILLQEFHGSDHDHFLENKVRALGEEKRLFHMDDLAIILFKLE